MFKSVVPNKSRYLVTSAVALLGLFAFIAGQSPASQAGEPVVSDAELQERIMARLEEIPDVGIDDLQVTVLEGDVQLSGDVETFDIWESVGEVVRATDGVKRLRNQLKIRSQQLIRRASDDQIVAAVRTRLEAHRIGPAVEVESRRGAVTLKGRVGDSSVRKTAGMLALSTGSVWTVDNRLEVIDD